MNEFTELIFNPITIIATLLAAFFVLMAFLRRRHPHHPSQVLRDESAAKPYHITNPYSAAHLRNATTHSTGPAPSPSLLATPPGHNSVSRPPRKVFRQFGQSALQPQADKTDENTGYIWE
jgi:hypothetical protein